MLQNLDKISFKYIIYAMLSGGWIYLKAYNAIFSMVTEYLEGLWLTEKCLEEVFVPHMTHAPRPARRLRSRT